MSKSSESVKVVVRCRPLNEDEKKAKYKRIVDMDPLRGSVLLVNPKVRPDEAKREFTYDAVYDKSSKQVDLYDETFRPIVDAVLKGFNGTVFAYGQTGTGKTYTMEGERDNPEKRGVIPNSFEHIFTHISRSSDEHYLVRASYLEIYLEEIRDLLSKDHTRRLDLKERPDTGVYVKDLSSFVAKSVKEIEHVMTVGNKNRSVGRTAMNEHSSRSHAIFIITVECSALREDGQYHIRAGKLNLVDLAGSERQSKTHATGDRFKEAAKINLSLSSLGNVISALVDGKSTHIPYRDSKLTRLLQDSLGGNAKTVMVANIGPAEYNYEETLSTLRYASRAKHITNKPRINEDPKDALLREYQDEIVRLKELLEKRKKKKGKYPGSGSSVGTSDEAESAEADRTSQESRSLKEQREQLEEQKKALLQNKELLSVEKEKLLAEVQSREKLLQKEQSKRDQLAAKIAAMESKLLAGNVKDRSDEAKKALERKRQEVIEQKRRERQIRQELEKKEESNLELKGTYTSLQEEIEIKTKKLQKIKFKLKSARAEIADFQNEQMRIREELALTISNLQQEQKLRNIIIENFISPDEVKKVKDRVVYKEEEEEWVLNPSRTQNPSNRTEVRPVSVKGTLYPVTNYARVAARSGDPRFMTDNILKIELDMPHRTTRDFEMSSSGYNMKPEMSRFNEEEITIDAGGGDSGMKTRGRIPQSKPKKTDASSSTTEGTNFPSSRGLVSAPFRFA